MSLVYSNGAPKPLYYPDGATLYLDWMNNTRFGNEPTISRNGEVLMLGPNGYQAFPANTLARIDGIGAQVAPARTNLFLNSAAPVTQTVTVVSGTVYTVSVVGSGSVTLSGAGTGVVTNGSAVTFTATGTSLTVTVSGSPTYAQVEAGSYASPPIITSGAAVSRPGDILSASVPDGGRAFVFEFDLLEPILASAGNVRRILNYQRNPVVANQSMSLALQDNGVIGLAVFRGGFITTVQFAAPVLGRNVCYGVFADNYIRGGVNSTDGSTNTTFGNITSDLGLCAFLNNGSNTAGNVFGYPGRFTERPVTDFATPADAFAWAKSIAQGWAS